MSLRASASFPSSCSGDMYWKVPMIVPRSVSREGAADVGRDEEASPPDSAAGASDRARPKSRSLTPDRVSMTLPGFRSR